MAPPTSNTVPMNALGRIPPDLLQQLASSAEEVVRSGWYVMGPNVAKFEIEFAAYCGVPHAFGVANGTDALELAVRAARCGPGDLVATVPNAGMYAAAAIVAAGATPHWIDVDAISMTMDPYSLEQRWDPRIKAVVVTHLYGKLGDIARIGKIAARHGAFVIEDCAQSHGAVRDGQKAGSLGDLAAFSFYPTKNLGALGDGGAITCKEDSIAHRITALRQYGWTSRYDARVHGGRNSRLDEIQAAMLRVMLPHLDAWNRQRRAIAKRFATAARERGVLRMAPAYDEDHVAHLLVAQTSERERVRTQLRHADIATDIHYPIPDHKQAAFTGRPEAAISLPVAEGLASSVVSLPCFPWLHEEEVSKIEEAIARL